MTTAQIPVHGIHDSKRDTRYAWLSLLLFPVSFVAAFAVGEGLAALLFDGPENADPSMWQVLAAGIPAVLVFALPAVPAWHFGMRAHRNGAPWGRVAAWVAVGLATGFVALNGVAYLFG